DGHAAHGVGGGGPRARRGAGRRRARAQLPAAGDPGRRPPHRRLPGAVADRRGVGRLDDRVLRRPLHGRDREDPQPGEDGADPGRGRRLLARRLHHRRPAARLEGRAPRRRGGVLRQHHRRGEGRDRRLLHLLQRRRGRGVRPGRPRGAVPARPVPRRARPAGHRPDERPRLGGGVPRARGHQRRRAHRTGRRPPRRRALRPPRVRLRHLRALPRRSRCGAPGPGADPLHGRDARRRPRLAREGGAGGDRGRDAAPAPPRSPGRRLPGRQRPRVLPLHEDDHTGEAPPRPAREARRGARGPRARRPRPRRRAADDRDRAARGWGV
ncbi:MAG: Quinolinate synthetase, partial [uncultured Pseudonocardia sp.]